MYSSHPSLLPEEVWNKILVSARVKYLIFQHLMHLDTMTHLTLFQPRHTSYLLLSFCSLLDIQLHILMLHIILISLIFRTPTMLAQRMAISTCAQSTTVPPLFSPIKLTALPSELWLGTTSSLISSCLWQLRCQSRFGEKESNLHYLSLSWRTR